jgi:succinate dehydrogenase / fumarate reductase membrane anchor subunit
MLFFVALLYHAWIGMRDILMDYIRATGLRLTLQVAVGLALLVYLIWSASILWSR